VKFHVFHTSFALDIATPVKFAIAAFLDLGLDFLVASVTAKFAAAIGTIGVFVANSPMSTHGANGVVVMAIIRRSFQKDQVIGSGNVAGSHPQPALTSGLDSCGSSVLVLEVVSNFPEGSQLLPTSD